jgi:hypothetical protein
VVLVSTNRKVTTMLPLTSRRRRDERGEGVLGIVIGAAIGLVILAGLLAFYAQSQKTTENTSVTARQEAAMVEAFNRVGRDIQESARVVRANSFEVVVERTLDTGTTVRTHYAVVGGNLITKRITGPAAYSSTDTTWQSSATTIIKQVSTPSPFSYKDKNGATTWTPANVRLVEINMEALTKTGKVPLKTAASIDDGEGGSTSTIRRTDPSAVMDIRTAPDAAAAYPNTMAVGVLANDTCNNGVTPCAVTSLQQFRIVNTASIPAGVTANVSGSMVNLTFASAPTAPFDVHYVIVDQYGSSEAVIRVRIPFRIGNVGAWDHRTNLVEIVGGTGPFRVERSAGASGIVCSACTDGGIMGGLQVVDNNQALGSAITYRVIEDTNSNGVYGDSVAGTTDQIATTSVVRQFPDNLQTWSQGSERGGTYSPTRGSNIVGARTTTAGTWPAMYGLKSFVAGPSRPDQWEGYYVDPANTVDKVVSTSTTCGNWWTRCATDSGRTAGSETLYKAYGLADIPASSSVAGDSGDAGNGLPTCTPYPGSPVSLVTYGTAKLCPSPDASLERPDYKASQVGAGNTAWGGTAAVSRAYQAPGAATSAGLQVGNSIPWYVAGDDCNDVADGMDTSVFNCNTRRAVVTFKSANSDNNVCTRNNFWSDLPSDAPAGCYNTVRAAPTTGGPFSAGATETQVTYNPWSGNVQEWFDAKTWGGTEGIWVYSCNIGGCSPDTSRAVRTYPQKSNFTSARQTVTPNEQTRWWGPQSHGGMEGAGDDCWSTGRPASCDTYAYPEARYTWSGSSGASHFLLSGNMAYREGQDYLSRYVDVNMGGGTLANVYIETGWVHELRIKAVSPNGLYQESKYLAGVPTSGSSYQSDSAVCRADVESYGWKWGLQWRPSAGFTPRRTNSTAISNDWQWPNDWYLFYWTGPASTSDWLYNNYGNGMFPTQSYGNFFGGMARYGLGVQQVGATRDLQPAINGGGENYGTFQNVMGNDRPLNRLLVGGGSYTQPFLPFSAGHGAMGAVRPWVSPNGWQFYGYAIPTNGTFQDGWGPARFVGARWGTANTSGCLPINTESLGTIFHGPWTPLESNENWNNNWYAVHRGHYVTRRVSRPEGWFRNPNPSWNDGCHFSCPY